MTGPHDDPGTLLHSPLDAEHRALGARMAEFGGWEMPIQYTGVLDEHRACREHAVVFDVSHLGSVRVSGPGAQSLIQWSLTNDLHRIEPGRAQYTHLLDEQDAHVVDDIIIWWLEADDLLVMPNASNTARLVGALEQGIDAHATSVVTVADVTPTRAVLAVQGPEAPTLVAELFGSDAVVPRFRVTRAPVMGLDVVVAGTGYTGERGVEMQVPAAGAAAVWQRLVDGGVTPAGLGARDTLRLEAGLPLHGHELGPGITPLQAGLGWVVRFDKGDFRGRDALLAERDRGVGRVLRGLAVPGRQVPRSGHPVRLDGRVVGEVTSGNFSPTLGHGIALAFVPPEVGEGSALTIDIRGRPVAATVVPLPFVPHAS